MLRKVNADIAEEAAPLPQPPRTFYARRGKRYLDVALGSLLLAASASVQAVVAVLVRSTLGRPVLFVQKRPGLHGTPMSMVKFRTMRNATDQRGRPLPDSQRLTRVGRALRASSLDELPELLNVVRGDLSLVGPRPLLMEYLDHYSPRQRQRHSVRPGITGLAQVSGRNTLSWEARFELDLEYVQNVSFRLDARIALRTITNVLLRVGISAPGHDTMPSFSQGGKAEESGE